MGLLIFLQVLFDLAFIATATLLLIERSKSRTMEDPRLSRGLQLLTNKIAILQDLMDRSETMSRQITQLIDGKQQDIQERIEEAEMHINKIQKATERSQEIAHVLQRTNLRDTEGSQYVQAAKMAHQGFSIEDIAKEFDIPRGELELIVKVNRDRLVTQGPRINQPPQITPVSQVTEVSEGTRYETIPGTLINDNTTSTMSDSVTATAPIKASSVMAPSVSLATSSIPSAAQLAAPRPTQEPKIRPVIFKRISNEELW